MMTVIFLGMMMLMMAQPMGMVTILFFVVLVYSVYLYEMALSFWYSYLMMLVMLSGILVIFTYMASMTPNEKFEMSLISLMVMAMGGIYGLTECWSDMVSFVTLKIWDGWGFFVSMYLVSFLLMIMLVVVWVSDWKSGAYQVKFDYSNS